jgi:hypothetical protein
MQVGKVLKRIFENAPVTADDVKTMQAGGFKITRTTRHEYDPDRRKTIDVHYHQFHEDEFAPSAPVRPCAPNHEVRGKLFIFSEVYPFEAHEAQAGTRGPEARYRAYAYRPATS